MKRRSFLVSSVALPIAGCIEGADDIVVEDRFEEGEVSEGFPLFEGDELTVEAEAGDEGATFGLELTHAGMQEDPEVESWSLEAGEEVEAEVRIRSSDSFQIAVSQGTVDLTVRHTGVSGV